MDKLCDSEFDLTFSLFPFALLDSNVGSCFNSLSLISSVKQPIKPSKSNIF